MKVYNNTDCYGNEIVVAANNSQEAHELFIKAYGTGDEDLVNKEEWFEHPVLEARCIQPQIIRY